MHSKDFLITIISWLLLGFLSASIFGAQHHLFERTQSGQLKCKFCKSKEADCVEEICSHALEEPHASVLQSMIDRNSAMMTEWIIAKSTSLLQIGNPKIEIANQNLRNIDVRLQKLLKKMQKFQSKIISLLPKQERHGSKTYCHRAAENLNFLKSNHRYRKFEPSQGPAIMTDEEYNDLLACSEEARLTAVVIRKIQDLLPGRYVVSSEVHPWFHAYDSNRRLDLMPDAFITHPAFCDIRYLEGGIPFGTPADPSIHMGVDIIDVRLDIGEKLKAFGQAMEHSEYFSSNTMMHNQTQYMFCNAVAFRQEIWLFHFQGQTVIDLEVVRWNIPGSAQRLIDFFRERDPISKVLNEVLGHVNMQVHRDKDGVPNAFLGAGAHGFVFKVHEVGSDVQRALKIAVTKAQVVALWRELSMNAELPEESIVKAAGSLIYCSSGGAGLLYVEVGAKVKAPPETITLAVQGKACDALVKLHRAGFAHGDARLENLLDFGIYKWCDAERARKVDDESKTFWFTKDISSLIESFGLTRKYKVVDARLQSYITNPSLDSLLALVKLCREVTVTRQLQ